MAPTPLSGRVLDRKGDPVAGAAVYIMEGPVPTPDIAQLTGPDGRFSLGLPAAGRYRIGVTAPGRQPHSEVVEVGRSGAKAIEIRIATGDRNDE